MASSGTGTRERVLDAACELMARQGYHKTTHQQICDLAGANVAAVNYYFGSKEQLYQAVWERAVELARSKYYSERGSAVGAEEAMRHLIEARIRCIFDDGSAGWLPRIIFREVTAPTPLEHQLFRRFVKPMMDEWFTLIRELLGSQATTEQVHCCVFNIHSQCVHLNAARHRGIGPFSAPLSDEGLSRLIAQMQEFSLAGVRHLRGMIERGELR